MPAPRGEDAPSLVRMPSRRSVAPSSRQPHLCEVQLRLPLVSRLFFARRFVSLRLQLLALALPKALDLRPPPRDLGCEQIVLLES